MFALHSFFFLSSGDSHIISIGVLDAAMQVKSERFDLLFKNHRRRPRQTRQQSAVAKNISIDAIVALLPTLKDYILSYLN